MPMTNGISEIRPAARLVSDYEAWLRSWASERTADARTALAKKLFKVWTPADFTAANIQTFLSGPSDKPWSAWTKATYRNHLNDLCSWLVANNYIDENPIGDVKRSKRPKSLPRPLSDAEVARVLSVVEGDCRAWVILAMQAGLRAHEIAKIRGEDITPEGVYVMGKGEVPAILPCHPDIWAMAQDYPRRGYLFPGSEDGHITHQRISSTIGALFRSIGIPKGSIHRFRHTYATTLLRNGVNIRRVQALMRHANLETTAAYTAVDEDELRDAILLLPGVGPVPPAA